jgi:Cu/Ag efflux protein CusF
MIRSVFAALAVAVASTAWAQGMKGMDMKGMDMKGSEAKEARVHKATGVVTRVDAAKNRVTIKHEPVASLGWPTMNMVFVVKDKAMLDKLAKDKKIDFEFVQQGREYVVTAVK